jgi:hypothetical protein
VVQVDAILLPIEFQSSLNLDNFFCDINLSQNDAFRPIDLETVKSSVPNICE